MSKCISSINSQALTLSNLTTGIAHVDSLGQISSSLLTNADITDATITQAKLAAGLVSTIVVRSETGSVSGQSDNSGFSLGQIIGMGISDPTKTISLGYNTSSNVGYLQAANADAHSPIIINPSGGIVSTANNTLDDGGDAIIAGDLILSALGAGIIHSSSAGLLTSSLILNADITDATISEAKLATSVSVTSSNDSIVKRSAAGAINTAALNASGLVTLSNYTTAGLLHNAVTTGLVSSSLIVDADITSGTISESKLATAVSTSNTANAIVKRDGSGNISLNAITAAGSLTLSSLSTGILHSSSDGVISSSLILNSDITEGTIGDSKMLTAVTANAWNDSIVKRNGSGGIASTTLNASGLVTLSNYTTAGILHNAVTTGLVSSSLIVDADITNATISESKLATVISTTNTANAIVKRGASGEISLGAITSAGSLTLSSLSTGLLHSSSGGVITSSLILNNDITEGTINDSKMLTTVTANAWNDSIAKRDSTGGLLATALSATNLVVTNSESSFIGADAIGATSCRLAFVKKASNNPNITVNNSNDIIFSKLSTSTITNANISSGSLTTLFTIANSGDVIGTGYGTFNHGVNVPSGGNYGLTVSSTNVISTPASNGAFFTDSLTNDMIIRSQSNNLLIGAGAGYSNLKMTTSGNTFLLPVSTQDLTSAYFSTGFLYQKAAETVTIVTGNLGGDAAVFTTHPPNCSKLSGFIEFQPGGNSLGQSGAAGWVLCSVVFSSYFASRPIVTLTDCHDSNYVGHWFITTPDQGGGSYDRFCINLSVPAFPEYRASSLTLKWNYHIILNSV
jgi:hypothetical protein